MIMKIMRFQWQGKIHWGILEGKERVFALDGDLYGEFRKGKELCRLADVRLLAPAEPTIMVACGMNYRARVKEGGLKEEPAEPILFFKPPTAVIGSQEDVMFPAIAREMRYEGELCVIMKRQARNVPENEAMKYVLGYTCGNELGAMDLMKRDKWMTRAKGFDHSGPLGPFLVTDLDPHNLTIESRLNNQTKQKSHTSLMIFRVEKLISFISAFMTLRPGDVIWTGTPEGNCNVQVGDVMEVEIEGIGILRNRVAAPRI
jgi:2-keto-4-pentenoate hydratase/2-oxohepta-3-ene-1,7-dioic acid hydratase in catechol pathway